MKRKFILVSFLFALNIFSLHSLEFTSGSPFYDMTWIFQSTFGFQNMNNTLISKESGGTTQISQALEFTGLLFQSYYKKSLTTKAVLNLGFEDGTVFYWTDENDFSTDITLNEKLRCVEAEYQIFLPTTVTPFRHFLPFIGYSFMNYSYSESYDVDENSFFYHSIVLGLEYYFRINRTFSHNYYLSFTPIIFSRAKDDVSYINYGAQLITDSHPIAVILNLGFKRGVSGSLWKITDSSAYVFSTAEVSLSFRINLR